MEFFVFIATEMGNGARKRKKMKKSLEMRLEISSSLT